MVQARDRAEAGRLHAQGDRQDDGLVARGLLAHPRRSVRPLSAALGRPLRAHWRLDRLGAAPHAPKHGWMLALLLAIAPTVLSLDDGHLTLTVPMTVQTKKQQVNFETDAYNLYEPSSASPLLTIVVGGGEYDLKQFSQFCLHGRRAWKTESTDSGSVAAGDPRVNAIAVSWSKLSGERLSEAQGIVSSMRIDWGAKC